MPTATAIFYYRIPGNTICGQRPAGTSLSILSPNTIGGIRWGFRPRCYGNLFGAVSGTMKLSDQAAREQWLGTRPRIV